VRTDLNIESVSNSTCSLNGRSCSFVLELDIPGESNVTVGVLLRRPEVPELVFRYLSTSVVDGSTAARQLPAFGQRDCRNSCIDSTQILFNDKHQVLIVDRVLGTKSGIYD